MDINSQIGDILAHYWLVEHQYCGMDESLILERLKEHGAIPLPINQLRSILLEMQEANEVVVGQEWIIFPTQVILEPRDLVNESDVGVYTKQLRLGGSQIELKYFYRQVLDRYRQDPRYEFKEFDLSGRITVKDAGSTEPSDLIYPQLRFGTAYRQDNTPVVAVILWDLGMLSKKHQQYWASYEINEGCRPDRDFIKQNFDAVPIDRISPQTALLGEMQEINKICNSAGEPKLFRETPEPYMMPKLGRPTKPTAEEFNYFALELDKLLSGNINKEFFKGKVDPRDARGFNKGTLTLLKEYLSLCIRASEDVIKEIYKPLKEVSKLRQIPAHRMTGNEFDTLYWDKQRELLKGIVKAVRLLRMILVEHFSLKNYTLPEWLSKWRIE